ncbi:Transcriptional regulatory protein YpdB [Burkholderiales bacterium]|nr:MAG: response regulator transcription factor [Burkholderiales bacterium]CAG0992206.1 Transcriptional regulatory protein YpdB [Burkholderiales bacterium]
MSPRALIADDELHLAEYLRDRLQALWPELLILPLAANGLEALRALEAEEPELAFLDIRMPGLTGLEVAQRAQGTTRVVFVTAYDQYAVEAFEAEAVDYLLKPVTESRLAQTVARVKRELAEGPGARSETRSVLARLASLLPELGGNGSLPQAGYLRWVRAAVGNQVRLIPIDEVCYFQSGDKYTSVFTAEAEFLIRTPLKDLLGELDPQRFWQVHRGTVVQASAVSGTARDLRGRVVVKLKNRQETLVVSRAYLHLFRQM